MGNAFYWSPKCRARGRRDWVSKLSSLGCDIGGFCTYVDYICMAHISLKSSEGRRVAAKYKVKTEHRVFCRLISSYLGGGGLSVPEDIKVYNDFLCARNS